jgi:hypothetical protein
MAASSFVYLMTKAKVKLLIRIRAALSMLVAFAAAMLMNVYTTYTVCMYVYNQELWHVEVNPPLPDSKLQQLVYIHPSIPEALADHADSKTTHRLKGTGASVCPPLQGG